MEISLALLRYEPTTPCLDATLTVAESSRGGDEQTGHVNGAPAGQCCSMHPRQKAWWPHAARRGRVGGVLVAQGRQRRARPCLLRRPLDGGGRTQHASGSY